MTEQLTLGAARASDPSTSHAAAARQRGGAKIAVEALFRRDPSAGWTAGEIEAALPRIYGPTLVSAVSQLKNDGVLVDSGRKRLSARGCEQIVWVLA